jgi:hypothetical protein
VVSAHPISSLQRLRAVSRPLEGRGGRGGPILMVPGPRPSPSCAGNSGPVAVEAMAALVDGEQRALPPELHLVEGHLRRLCVGSRSADG